MRLLLLPLVMLITPVALSEDYVWKSKAEPIDYKCVVDAVGGFLWGNSPDAHKVVPFKPDNEDIFITHISNIPSKAFLELNGTLNYGKSQFENYLFEDLNPLNLGGLLSEKRSYFIRTSDDAPKLLSTYTQSSICTYSKSDNLHGLSCSETDRSFSFDLNTMRFVSSYLGTWHQKNKDSEYAGDSAVITYGTCSKYFR